MSQHYVNPAKVVVPDDTYTTKLGREIIERDGQIVPCLVYRIDDPWFEWQAADRWQGAVVLICRALEWETMLVEDEWTEDDL